jgi:hypothetical protein
VGITGISQLNLRQFRLLSQSLIEMVQFIPIGTGGFWIIHSEFHKDVFPMGQVHNRICSNERAQTDFLLLLRSLGNGAVPGSINFSLEYVHSRQVRSGWLMFGMMKQTLAISLLTNSEVM